MSTHISPRTISSCCASTASHPRTVLAQLGLGLGATGTLTDWLVPIVNWTGYRASQEACICMSLHSKTHMRKWRYEQMSRQWHCQCHSNLCRVFHIFIHATGLTVAHTEVQLASKYWTHSHRLRVCHPVCRRHLAELQQGYTFSYWPPGCNAK